MRSLALNILLGSAALCAMGPPAHATTASSLSSFEGEEEPTVLYHPSNAAFTNDSFDNITDQGGGVIRTTLRYRPDQDWWDGDRNTTNDDRQRAEVKGLGVHQKTDQTFRYTFDFRTDPDMVGTSSFFHIFQLKSTDGDDAPPLVTLSLYENGVGRLKLWSGTATASTTVRTFNWTPDTWKHADILITTSLGSTGSLLASINGDAFTGATGLPAFRPDATDYRPKWGFYRGIDSGIFVGINWLEHRNVTSAQVAATELIWNPSPPTTLAWDTTDANNWIKKGLPGAFSSGDNVIFSETGIGSVIVPAAGVTAGAITVENSSGTYQFTGGPIGGSGTLRKAGAGTLKITNAVTSLGSATLSGGTLVVNGSLAGFLTVNSGATVKGAGTFANINLLLGARCAPGDSLGTMTVNSLAMSGTSQLEFELAGLTASSGYDRLQAAGPVQLSGALAVSLTSGFVPQAGQLFDIITASTIQGTFASVQLPQLADDLAWQVRYQPKGVSLAVLASGDFNRDSLVNAADLARWSSGFPLSDLGDSDGDRDSDGADFLSWQRQLGAAQAVAAQAAVPEPMSVALLALAAGFASIARRRRALRRIFW